MTPSSAPWVSAAARPIRITKCVRPGWRRTAERTRLDRRELIHVDHNAQRESTDLERSALAVRARRDQGTTGDDVWLEGTIGVSEVVHATMRGAIASMAMTGMRAVTVSLGFVQQPPPQQIAGESRGPRRAAVEVAHW